MKTILGLLLIVGGLVLGLYVGIWVCFIGGIVDILTQIQSPTTIDAMVVAIGIAKIIFATLAGVLSAIVFVLPGIALIDSK